MIHGPLFALARITVDTFFIMWIRRSSAYHTPTNEQSQPEAGPVQDLHRAIRLVRSRAAEFQVDPNRIGVIGHEPSSRVFDVIAGKCESRSDVASAAQSLRDCDSFGPMYSV